MTHGCCWGAILIFLNNLCKQWPTFCAAGQSSDSVDTRFGFVLRCDKVMGMAHVGIERVQPWSSCPEAAALFPQPLRVKPCSFRSTQEPVLAGWGDTFRLFNGFYGSFCKHRGLYLFGQAPIDLCSRRSGAQEYGGATRKAKLGINFRRSLAYSGETPKGSTGWGLHMVCFPEVGLKST